MGKLVFDISMSLDGFITGANVRQEAGLGDGGERLHEWIFNNPAPLNRAVTDVYTTYGANIFGRRTYELSLPYWGADGPTGEARVPTVIVSHSVPQNVPPRGVYHFADSIEAAYATAKKLAGDKDIYLTGANVARQFLQRSLVDEISIHLVPVLFSSGIRLFENLQSEHIALEVIEVRETAEVIHMRFRVMK